MDNINELRTLIDAFNENLDLSNIKIDNDVYNTAVKEINELIINFDKNNTDTYFRLTYLILLTKEINRYQYGILQDLEDLSEVTDSYMHLSNTFKRSLVVNDNIRTYYYKNKFDINDKFNEYHKLLKQVRKSELVYSVRRIKQKSIMYTMSKIKMGMTDTSPEELNHNEKYDIIPGLKNHKFSNYTGYFLNELVSRSKPGTLNEILSKITDKQLKDNLTIDNLEEVCETHKINLIILDKYNNSNGTEILYSIAKDDLVVGINKKINKVKDDHDKYYNLIKQRNAYQLEKTKNKKKGVSLNTVSGIINVIETERRTNIDDTNPLLFASLEQPGKINVMLHISDDTYELIDGKDTYNFIPFGLSKIVKSNKLSGLKTIKSPTIKCIERVMNNKKEEEKYLASINLFKLIKHKIKETSSSNVTLDNPNCTDNYDCIKDMITEYGTFFRQYEEHTKDIITYSYKEDNPYYNMIYLTKLYSESSIPNDVPIELMNNVLLYCDIGMEQLISIHLDKIIAEGEVSVEAHKLIDEMSDIQEKLFEKYNNLILSR